MMSYFIFAKNSMNKIIIAALFILSINDSILLAQSCDDIEALNFDSLSNSSIDCVYFNIPYPLTVDEDEIYTVDLLDFASGAYEDSDFQFDPNSNYNCNTIQDIELCSIDDSIIQVEFKEHYNGFIQLPQLYFQYQNNTFNRGIAINVNPVNDYPEIIIEDDLDLQFSIGEEFQYTINVYDPDNNNFSFELVNNPAGSSLVDYSTLAIFSYTPQNEDSFVFEVEVRDNMEPLGIDSHIFTVNIIDQTNELPDL